MGRADFFFFFQVRDKSNHYLVRGRAMVSTVKRGLFLLSTAIKKKDPIIHCGFSLDRVTSRMQTWREQKIFIKPLQCCGSTVLERDYSD